MEFSQGMGGKSPLTTPKSLPVHLLTHHLLKKKKEEEQEQTTIKSKILWKKNAYSK